MRARNFVVAGTLAAFALALIVAACGGGGGGGGTAVVGGGGGGGSGNGAQVARFVYVANDGDNTVSIYSVGADGMLRNRGYALTGATPLSVAVDPSGKFAYVANFGDSTISSYSIDASNGTLSQIDLPVSTGTAAAPASVTIHPSGRFLYVANNTAHTVAAFKITDTGALDPVPGSPFDTGGTASTAIAIEPSGRFVYVANTGSGDISAFSIEATTGALTRIDADPSTPATKENFATGQLGAFSLAIDAPGKVVYVVNSGASHSVSAFGIEPSGALSSVGAPVDTKGDNPQSIALDPLGRFAYVANTASDSISAFRILAGGLDFACSVQEVPADAATPVKPAYVSVDPTGRFLYVANFVAANVGIYAIDQTSGCLMRLGARIARANPRAVAMTKGTSIVTDTPKFAYVTDLGVEQNNFVGGGIFAYSIDPSRGSLTPVQSLSTGRGSTAVAADPLGRFVYVANALDGNVSGFSINAANGMLMPVPGSPTSAGSAIPVAAIADPSGRFLYAVNDGAGFVLGSVAALALSDSGSGSLNRIVSVSPPPASPHTDNFDTAGETGSTAIAIDPSGRFVYLANTSALGDGFNSPANGGITIFRTERNGRLTLIEELPVSQTVSEPGPVAVDPSGKFLYVASPVGISVYRIDQATGVLRLPALSGSPFPTGGTNPSSIAFDPSGRFLYAADFDLGAVAAFTMNADTGTLQTLGSFATGSGDLSLSIDPSGRFVYVTNSAGMISVFAIQPGGVLDPKPALRFTGQTIANITTVGITQ